MQKYNFTEQYRKISYRWYQQTINLLYRVKYILRFLMKYILLCNISYSLFYLIMLHTSTNQNWLCFFINQLPIDQFSVQSFQWQCQRYIYYIVVLLNIGNCIVYNIIFNKRQKSNKVYLKKFYIFTFSYNWFVIP